MPSLEELSLMVVLICFVLDTDKVGISMCSLSPTHSSSVKYLLLDFAHFSTELFVYFPLLPPYRESQILDIVLILMLHNLGVTRISSQFVAYC